MSGISSINTNINSVSLSAESVKPQVKPVNSEIAQCEQPKSDSLKVGVKKGIVPTLKGAGLGAVLGTSTSIAIAQIAEKGQAFAGTGGIAMVPIIGAALFTGAAIGGVTSNLTNNKTQGAIGGAIAGGVTGGYLAAKVSKGDLKGALIGAGLGAVVGAVSGFAGAAVAKAK